MTNESSTSQTNWNKEFLETVVNITRENVASWCDILNKFGMDVATRERWANIFIELVKDSYKDIIQEITDHQNALFDEIENLLKQSSVICKELHIKMPDHGSQQLTLCQERRILKERIQEYEKLLQTKLKEMEKLNTQEIELCKALARPTKTLIKSPLPSPDVVDEFKNYLESLEFEKFERIAHFSSLQGPILQIVNELNYKPTLDFERTVISSEESEFIVSDSNMMMLNNFYDSLNMQLNNTKEEITALREKIRSLWETLDEDPKYSNEFIQKYAGNTLDTLDALKKEVDRCEALRKANIEVFVKTSRKKILQLWDKCHFTSQERDFEFFHTDLYTEDLLALHDIEMQKMERYYTENERIFHLLEERKNLWEKLVLLENKANQPDRYKNRGGQLLKEEKDRNAVSKRIPQIEEQLLQLSKTYEASHRKPFLSWGETIEAIISHDHAKHEEEKKLKLSARKIKRDNTITPAKSTLGLTRSISAQNLGKLTTADMGTLKRKMVMTPLRSAKRHRPLLEQNENAPQTAPSKSYANGKRIGPSRLSLERAKRIAKCRKILQKNAQKCASKENVAVYPTEYDAFEMDIENKENCRSTIFLDNDSETLAVPLPVTPHRINKASTKATTPSASSSRAQSPYNTAKLTPAPSLKLLF